MLFRDSALDYAGGTFIKVTLLQTNSPKLHQKPNYFFLNHKGVKIEKITWLNTFYNVFFRRLFQTLTPNGVPERDIPVCSSALSFYNESASWLLLPSVDMVVGFHRFFFTVMLAAIV